jgi:hypothetical protein
VGGVPATIEGAELLVAFFTHRIGGIYGRIDGMTDRGSLLVARLHIDLALVSSAVCRALR